MVKILLSEQAEADLEGVVDFLKEKNSELPQRFIDELTRVYSIVLDHPKVGRGITFSARNYLMYPMVKFSYTLFYRIENDKPIIVRVIHGRRDFESLFDEN